MALAIRYFSKSRLLCVGALDIVVHRMASAGSSKRKHANDRFTSRNITAIPLTKHSFTCNCLHISIKSLSSHELVDPVAKIVIVALGQ